MLESRNLKPSVLESDTNHFNSDGIDELIIMMYVGVCICVCERERDKERDTGTVRHKR